MPRACVDQCVVLHPLIRQVSGWCRNEHRVVNVWCGCGGSGCGNLRLKPKTGKGRTNLDGKMDYI